MEANVLLRTMPDTMIVNPINVWILEAMQSAGCLEAETQAGRYRVRDWPETERLLNRHGLASLATAVMSPEEISATVPCDVLARLKRARHQGAIAHQTALRALANIHPRFVREDIPYAVLKGPHLQETLYTPDCPRLSGDVDLLVRRGDLDRAADALREAGYRPAGGALSRFLLRHIHFHLLFLPLDKGLPKIELHWSLVDRANLYRVPDEEVLARAVDLDAGTVRFRVLSREDTLLYLCLHMAKHGVLNAIGLRSGQGAPWFCRKSSGNRLIWCLDVALWLQHEFDRADVDLIHQRATAWNVVPELVESLRVMEVVLPSSPARAARNTLWPADGAEAVSRTG
ncbi:MAG: nucleotidyltransferase family protein [Kiritimatiellae bacterium]|nr:nucleotidyltransferase family protein [Kiritimatiellia bacterium]